LRAAFPNLTDVSRSTASGHLSKLVAARLLTVTRERRFSYYRIASPLVATKLESQGRRRHRGATPPSAAVDLLGSKNGKGQ
jgi:DNA-binding transcriptional ArsR family regulator